MEYAEAMSQTPPAVTDEMSAGLLEQLGASALIELTAMIGYANLAARTNTALGIESEGLSRVCKIPLADRPVRYAASARLQIGRASCRERVCQAVSLSVVAVSLKKKKTKNNNN